MNKANVIGEWIVILLLPLLSVLSFDKSRLMAGSIRWLMSFHVMSPFVIFYSCLEHFTLTLPSASFTSSNSFIAPGCSSFFTILSSHFYASLVWSSDSVASKWYPLKTLQTTLIMCDSRSGNLVTLAKAGWSKLDEHTQKPSQQ